MKRRIAELTPILTQMNELAELTERYYEKGYYRSEKYSSNCFYKIVNHRKKFVEEIRDLESSYDA